MLHYIRHKDIDKDQWDNCITNASNGLIYGFSWYLDIVSPGWDAVINEDYTAVMPLPWKQKYGITYVIQPVYTKHLGVFSLEQLTKEDIRNFFDTIPYKYVFINLLMNTDNQIKKSCIEQTLYVQQLDLNRTYGEIANNYSKSNRKNIKKAYKNHLRLEPNLPMNTYLVYKEKYPVTQMARRTFPILKRLIQQLHARNLAEFYGVYDHNNNLNIAGFFIHTANRSILLNSVLMPEGKANKAKFFMLDAFLQDHAEQNRILDFAGSNIPGIAYVNRGYGASDVPYYNVMKSRLPFIKSMYRLKQQWDYNN